MPQSASSTCLDCQTRRIVSEQGRYTLIFLAADEDQAAPGERASAEVGSLTIGRQRAEANCRATRAAGASVISPHGGEDTFATCQRLVESGVLINRSPRDGHMALIRSPDGISINLPQVGAASPRPDRSSRCQMSESETVRAGRLDDSRQLCVVRLFCGAVRCASLLGVPALS